MGYRKAVVVYGVKEGPLLKIYIETPEHIRTLFASVTTDSNDVEELSKTMEKVVKEAGIEMLENRIEIV